MEGGGGVKGAGVLNTCLVIDIGVGSVEGGVEKREWRGRTGRRMEGY